MIESEVIVYSFIAGGVISLIGLGVFIWMNLNDRNLDEKIIRDKTHPRDILSKYRYYGKSEDDGVNPMHELRKYAVGGAKKEKKPSEIIIDKEQQKLAQSVTASLEAELLKEEINSEQELIASKPEKSEQNNEIEQIASAPNDDTRFAPKIMPTTED